MNHYLLSDFASYWFLVSGKRVDLTLQDVLDAEIDLLNFFITLVKLHIWISRKHGVTPYLRILLRLNSERRNM